MGWDEDSLKDKGKVRKNQGINLLSPIGRQVFNHLQGSRVQHMEQWLEKTNATSTEAIEEPKLLTYAGYQMTQHCTRLLLQMIWILVVSLIDVFLFFLTFRWSSVILKFVNFCLVKMKITDAERHSSGKRCIKSLHSGKIQSLTILKLCRFQSALKQQMLDTLQ